MSNAILKIENFEPGNVLESSYLNADAEAGAAVIQIKDPQSFKANYFALVGKPAQENTELRSITDVTGSMLTVPALDRKHKRLDNITLLAADKIQIWRGMYPTDGSQPTAAMLARYGVAIDIDYDNMETRYVDADGSGDYIYGFTYYNSLNLAESDIEDSVIVRGGTVADYATEQGIREEANIENNPFISSGYVFRKLAQAEAHINDRLRGFTTVPFTDPIPATIERITELLTAGYILKREYGAGANGTTGNGTAKIKEADAELDKIISGNSDLGPGTSTAAPSRRVRGWPNSTTKDTPSSEGGGKRKVRTGMRF